MEIVADVNSLHSCTCIADVFSKSSVNKMNAPLLFENSL